MYCLPSSKVLHLPLPSAPPLVSILILQPQPWSDMLLSSSTSRLVPFALLLRNTLMPVPNWKILTVILILLYVFFALILWSKPHSDVSSSVFPGRFSYCCYLCCWAFYYWCMSFHHNWYITYPLYLQSTIPISGPNPIPSSGPEPIPIPGPNPLPVPVDWILLVWNRLQVF